MGSRISRRNFLRRALAAGTACAIPSVVPSSVFGANSPAERITLGFVGTGNQGIENIKAFLNKRGCEVVAVCDVDAARREKARLTAKLSAKSSYNDFRELLTRNDIDAVVVCTPDHWHALVSVAAAKAGKDIYCEKPLAYNITEGRALCNAVRRYGRILQTGTQQRSDSNFRFACELVRNGRIGRLHTIKVEIPVNSRPNPLVWKVEPPPEGLDYDLWLGPASYRPYIEQGCHYNWHFLYEFGWGQITNWGAHWFDIAQWGNGTERTGPVEVEGRGEFPEEGLFETPLRVSIEYRYANGVRMLCETTRTNETGDFGASIRFEGESGWIFISRHAMDAEPKSLLREKLGAGEVRLYLSNDHHQNFLDCVHKRSRPAADVEIGHRTASVCHLGDIAIRLGEKLKWDPQSECFIGNDNANKMLSRSMRPPWRL